MKKFLFSLMIFALCFSVSAVENFTTPAYADEVGDLFDTYVPKINPEKAILKISEQPDSTGLLKDAYVEITGAAYKNIRVDSAKVRAGGLQFNPKSEWQSGKNLKLNSFQSAYVTVDILEEDINKALANQNIKFRDSSTLKNFILHDASVDITADAIKLKGLVQENGTSGLQSYAAAWLFGAAADDYPIEITSKLKVVNGKELWLDSPQVTGNYSIINNYVEKNITKREKPIAKLESNIPLTFDQVTLKDGSLTISTTTLPTDLTGGTEYTYPKNSGNNSTGNNSTGNNNTGNNSTENNSTGNNSTGNTNADATFGNVTDTVKTTLESADVKAKIEEKLGSLATSYPIQTTEPATVDTTETITDAQVTSALKDETLTSSLSFAPRKADTSGTYPLGTVSLSGQKAGTKIALYMLVKNASSGEFTVADSKSVKFKIAETVSNSTFFLDASGNIIDTVTAGVSNVTAVAPMDAGIEYTPVVAFTEETQSQNNNVSSSGSGCDIGIGAMIIAACGAFAFFRKH